MHPLLCWHRPRFERGDFREPEAALVDVRELVCVVVAVAIRLVNSGVSQRSPVRVGS